MNRKGFTLIELLAVIVIIGILGVLIVPGILNNVNNAEETAYNTLIKNIVTSSQMYYEECEYGDLSDNLKYGDYACKIIREGEDGEDRISYTEITLGTLVNTGFLKVNDIDSENQIKIVKNPITDNDISNCKIKIIKKVNPSTFKVIYKLEKADTQEICPTSYE